MCAAALLALVPLMAAQTERQRSVTAVRNWASAGTTRIAIEVSGTFSFRSDRLHNPERVYFDILNARPNFASRRLFSEALAGPLAQRIRVAETTPGVTRIVIDLGDSVDVSSSTLSNPHRLIVELKKGKGQGAEAEGQGRAAGGQEAGAGGQGPGVGGTAEIPSATATIPLPAPLSNTPARTEKVSKASPDAPRSAPKAAPQEAGARGQGPRVGGTAEIVSATATIPLPAPPSNAPARTEKASKASPDTPRSLSKTAQPEVPGPRPPTPGPQNVLSAPARRTTAGESSLVRALGLKISRVVIDAGHGGHDQGAQGIHGLLEKDLVLDMALRVGKLVETRMGAEVIYTRSDDTFIPLRERTALANEKKADLFLSIHANSSPAAPKAAGIETYYLNITGTKEAMDVAARENATSDQSVFDLADLIQKIAKQDKAEESREFANRLQATLYAFEAKNVPAAKNRGVKSAPLVVLIGANMPSVLAEIGFLSNSREEALLKKPDYRQKLAEALYRGLSRYADSLSHFQTAAVKGGQ